MHAPWLSVGGKGWERYGGRMENSMIERVARAIYETHCANHMPPIQARWDDDPHGRDIARKDARTAIQAMREPTDGMIQTGIRAASFEVEEVEGDMVVVDYNAGARDGEVAVDTSMFSEGPAEAADELNAAATWRAMIDAALGHVAGGPMAEGETFIPIPTPFMQYAKPPRTPES